MRMRPMARAFVATFLAASLLCCAVGCVPSTSKVIKMRSTTSVSRSKKNCETLLKYFRDDRTPKDKEGHIKWVLWRIETLRTLHHFDRQFNYVADESSLHSRLIEATKSEYEYPKAAAKDDQIRAWAINLMSQSTSQQPVSYFVEVLLENSRSNDPDYVVCLAALDALYSRMDNLAAIPLLKRKVLYRVAQISSDLNKGRIYSRRKKELVLAIDCFQQQLKSYTAVVDLLRTSATENDIRTLLEILKWNYQQLKIGSHLSTSGESKPLFAQNILTLLTLSWHYNADVRARSRLIMAEFAADALFDAITKRVADKAETAPEDYQQLVTLMIRLDRDPSGGARAKVRKNYRDKALRALFAALPEIPLDQREIVYGQLLASAPKELCQGLLAYSGRIVNENEEFALQHLRYLEHLRNALAAPDKAAGEKTDIAVAAFMQHPALSVKKQVAASLASRNPVLFARCCVPVITSMAGESAVTAGYLFEAYMDTLARLESAGLLKDLIKTMAPRDPYAILAHGITRPELAIRFKVANFLRTRNCDLLVRMLSNDLTQRIKLGRRIDSREWCVLGDIAQEQKGTLTKNSLASACSVLVRGLSSPDSEQGLLCARYLLELGYDPAKIVSDNPDIKAMVDMAQAKSKTAKTPSNDGDK